MLPPSLLIMFLPPGHHLWKHHLQAHWFLLFSSLHLSPYSSFFSHFIFPLCHFITFFPHSVFLHFLIPPKHLPFAWPLVLAAPHTQPWSHIWVCVTLPFYSLGPQQNYIRRMGGTNHDCNTTSYYSTDTFNQIQKAIPLQAWTGPEGSRRLRLPDFKTIGTLRW